MNPILPDNERTDFEDRTYANPNLTVAFTDQFIDNYRNLQKQNNAEIATQTRNLGTDIPSNLGGLVGAGSYFTSRYQTPQTNQTLQNLRTAAQADALKTALANEKAMWQKRYQDAYRAYQKRQNDKTNTTTTTDLSDILKKLGIDTNENEPGTEGNNSVDLYDSESFLSNIGKVLPMSDTASKWRDPKTGYWYMVTSPTEFDAITISNSLAGRNPVNGATTSINGKNFIYDSSKDMWYERGPYLFGQGD